MPTPVDLAVFVLGPVAVLLACARACRPPLAKLAIVLQALLVLAVSTSLLAMLFRTA